MNSVYIEITDACNLHCSFCPSSTLGEQRHFMDEAVFEKCLNDIQGIADSVYFHVLGEPLLHPHFIDFTNKLKSRNLQLNLTTNGTLLHKFDDVLLNCGALRQINVSTHAYAELPFETAAKHLETVLNFAESALEKRPELYINLRLWNVGDASSNAWNAYVLEAIEKRFGTRLELGNFCSRHKSFIVRGRLYLHQDSRFEWPETTTHISPNCATSRQPIIKGTCRALDTHVGILYDGRVVACCLDYSGQITLGNIQEQSLQQILESPLAMNLREGFANHELRHPFCQKCGFCKRFK